MQTKVIKYVLPYKDSSGTMIISLQICTRYTAFHVNLLQGYSKIRILNSGKRIFQDLLSYSRMAAKLIRRISPRYSLFRHYISWSEFHSFPHVCRDWYSRKQDKKCFLSCPYLITLFHDYLPHSLYPVHCNLILIPNFKKNCEMHWFWFSVWFGNNADLGCDI